MSLSVCLFVTIVSPAKTAEPMEMLFGLCTRVGPKDNNNNNNPICKAPECQKTSVALE